MKKGKLQGNDFSGNLESYKLRGKDGFFTIFLQDVLTLPIVAVCGTCITILFEPKGVNIT